MKMTVFVYVHKKAPKGRRQCIKPQVESFPFKNPELIDFGFSWNMGLRLHNTFLSSMQENMYTFHAQTKKQGKIPPREER